MKNLIPQIIAGIEGKEAQYYLDKFHHDDPTDFAVIKISGECTESSLEMIVSDLSKLHQLDLYPIVIFGWGKKLNHKLATEGISPQFIDGNRITDQHTMDLILEVVGETMKEFAALAHSYNLPIAASPNPVFHGEQIPGGLGLVGNVIGVDAAYFTDACKNGKIPIVTPLALSPEGIVLNVNADTASAHLVKSIHPDKYIAVTSTGGILDNQGRIIRKLSIIDDYDNLVASGTISGGMLKKLQDAKSLLESIGNGYSMHITSPLTLFTELFSYLGAGTKITLGYHIAHHPDLSGIHKDKLSQILESAFNGTLVPDYFESGNISGIVLEEDYDGAAVLEAFQGWTYIDKFAVSAKSRENGLGSKIFSEIMKEHGNNPDCSGIFWRSDRKNTLNSWYFRKIVEYSGNCKVGDDWIVYWLSSSDQDPTMAIDYALNKPKTIIKNKGGND